MSNQSLVLSKPHELNAYLQKAAGTVKAALPSHMNPDRMLRLALTCFSTTPKLRECTAQSILGSIVVASQLGLEPGVAGQGYLIPYKNRKTNISTCTFVPGWQGLVGLLNNSGRATAWTGAVFQGDEWQFELGSNPKCRHIPGDNFGDPDKMTWVYACGKVNGSEQTVVEAWPVSRVWRHRDKYNKVGDDHYSYGNEEMYARKVVLLQVLKYMPRSVELQNALVAANAAEIGMTSKVEAGVVIEAEVDDIPMGYEPKQVSATTEPAKSAESPQEKLAAACTAANITLEEFRDWAESTGQIPDAVAVCSDWSMVPTSHATRILRIIPKMTGEINKAREAK